VIFFGSNQVLDLGLDGKVLGLGGQVLGLVGHVFGLVILALTTSLCTSFNS